MKIKKHLKLAADGTMASISATGLSGAMLSIHHDYTSHSDVVLAIFSQAVVIFGIHDYSDKIRRRALLKAALQYYATTHNDRLLSWIDGDMVVGSTKFRIGLPLKRGIHITIGNRWAFTYRPGAHVKNSFHFDEDSLSSKIFGCDASKEPINFEQLLADCRHIRSFA